ncbi:MarR family transcriptional regulator [Arthrobacter koreensis]|uniref:MarR family transcriptional regulator n=1 Tax=Arthrobacter koreensis TaxID=199136 RepID=UPI002DB906C6|nr:MarR family transcriptional regulator [Arthrobacter koreensis]MEB7505314.1 MarR family transcriptional regulator [Arthrobacter koreensis]
MFVLTIDQKDSRNSSDRVPELLELLGSQDLALPFERTVGDEVQAVASSPAAVIDAALLTLRQGGWSVGIGVGNVGLPLPASTREAGGEAFIAARAAVDRAKKTGDRPPIAVAADPNAGPEAAEAAAHAEAVLILIAGLVRDRSEAEWRILEHVDPHKWGSQSAAARMLGISSQAVSNAVQRAKWQEEWAARPAAEVLLDRADQAACSPPR